MNRNSQLEISLVATAFLQDFTKFSLNFSTHRNRALNDSFTLTIGAGFIDFGVNTFRMPLKAPGDPVLMKAAGRPVPQQP